MVQLTQQDIKTREVLEWQGLHLIHFAGSTCSQKARIFLNLKGLDWVSHPLNLIAQENYKPWFLGINPRGLVPVLVHDGVVHIESNDILLYLEEQFPAQPLIPTDIREDIVSGLAEEDNLHMDIRSLTMRFVFPSKLAQKKAASLQVFEQNHGTVRGESDPHKNEELRFWKAFASNGGITDARAREAAHRFHECFARFEQALANAPYLRGDAVSLLDIAWFIYTHRLTAATYPFQRLHPRVHDWYQRLLARDEFRKEVINPLPARLVSGTLHGVQKMRGTTLEKIAGF